MKEKWSRSLIKTILWRCIATGTTLAISFILTGSLAIAGSIASIDFFIKMVLYFVYERICQRIDYGTE